MANTNATTDEIHARSAMFVGEYNRKIHNGKITLPRAFSGSYEISSYSECIFLYPTKEKRKRTLVVPENILEKHGIDNRATIIGAGDHLEIWNPEKWKKYYIKNQKTYEQLLSSALGI